MVLNTAGEGKIRKFYSCWGFFFIIYSCLFEVKDEMKDEYCRFHLNMDIIERGKIDL